MIHIENCLLDISWDVYIYIFYFWPISFCGGANIWLWGTEQTCSLEVLLKQACKLSESSSAGFARAKYRVLVFWCQFLKIIWRVGTWRTSIVRTSNTLRDIETPQHWIPKYCQWELTLESRRSVYFCVCPCVPSIFLLRKQTESAGSSGDKRPTSALGGLPMCTP